MDLSPEVQQLAVSLAATAARNSAQIVADQVRTLRASRKNEETISGLEEIISELIDDKAELTRIAQSYQAELVAQTITAGDVRYITETVVPILERLAAADDSPNGGAFRTSIENLKPLLSAETVTVLQMLGFNFRRAIGEPLTRLCETAILAKANRSEDLQIAQLRREQLLAQIALDEAAHARLMAMYGRA